MTDFAICRQEDCKLKETCKRYKAKPDKYYQAYLPKKFLDKEECLFYIPTNTND